MLRKLHLVALGAFASAVAVTPAAAGGEPYAGCAAPCPPVYSGCAAPCAPYGPMYVVNQGPVYYGPGIVTSPAIPGYGCEGPCAPYGPRAYPYVGHDYYYPRYHGGPYADPIRHHVYPRHHYRYRPAMIYVPNPGPRVIQVSGAPRPAYWRSGPRRAVKPPLEPKDK